ncbi:MAG TPA: DUF2269 family protein [Candidatus Omnitrophota bacterium]|nr:DUF2269 family protein [Candidatus Omnitrophota bacterium]
MRSLLVYLHAASAVALIGELLYAGFWLRSALARGGGSAITRYTLATMEWTSKSVALPAILVNLITGLGLLHFAHIHFSRSKWVVVSLLLYVVLTGVWHGMLIPTRKKMQRLVESEPAAGYAKEERETSSEFLGMAKRWISVNAAALVLVFGILALMVLKPTF